MFAQAYGRGSPVSVATILTAAGGVWSYIARPRIQTAYQAGWQGGLSPQVAVGVHPAISLKRTATGALLSHVSSSTGFRGRVVQLQRHTAAGKWVTVRRIRLNRSSQRDLQGFAPAARTVIRPRGHEHQSGRRRLPGRQEPHDHRQARVEGASLR